MGRFKNVLLSLDTKRFHLVELQSISSQVKCHRKSDQWLWSVQKNVRQGEIFLYPCLVISSVMDIFVICRNLPLFSRILMVVNREFKFITQSLIFPIGFRLKFGK